MEVWAADQLQVLPPASRSTELNQAQKMHKCQVWKDFPNKRQVGSSPAPDPCGSTLVAYQALSCLLEKDSFAQIQSTHLFSI